MSANILHLSDVHFSRRNHHFDQTLVLDAFRESVRVLCDGPTAPDLVIISGDLAYSADEDGVYYDLYDKFIGQLSILTRCPDTKIVLCPGNHDAHRKGIEKHSKDIPAILSKLDDRSYLNDGFLDGRWQQMTSDIFAGYLEFQQYFAQPTAESCSSFYSVYKFDNPDLDVISVNSAWLTGGGLKERDSDQQRLAIPEAVIHSALKNCRDGITRILVTHHPIGWLAEANQQDVQKSLKGIDVHLYGHMHVPRPASISDLNGGRLSNQAGAIYDNRERYNGYGLVRLDSSVEAAAIVLRSYFERTQSFSAAEDVILGGVFYPSAVARMYWEKVDRRVDRARLANWIEHTLRLPAEGMYNQGIVDRSLAEIFVVPPLVKLKNAELDSEKEGVPEEHEVAVDFTQLISGNENVVFYGKREYGKTTILRQFALGGIRASIADPSAPRVPVIVDFAEIKPGTDPVKKLIARSLLAEPDGFSPTQLLDEGYMIILLDDVAFGDARRISLLREFISLYPRNRYILTTSTGTESALGIETGFVVNTDMGISFVHVSIKPFTRNKLRSFVEKWNGSGTQDCEDTLNRISKELKGMHIPVTAVNGTILLSVYELFGERAPINRAVLVERFLEHLLEKSRVEIEILRKNFDFNNKMFVLAYVAEQMVLDNNYVLDYDALVELVRNCLDKIGLNQPPKDLVDYFVRARVFSSGPDNQIQFRYRAFLEFLIAWRMREDEAFKSVIYRDENYLRFTNEIQYLAGLNRTDAALLEMIADRYSALHKAVEVEMNWSPDLGLIDNLKLPGSEEEKDLFADYEAQMQSPPLIAEERDTVLQADLPRDAEDRQEVFRPKMAELGHRYLGALFLYSGLVKNLELIGDDVKRKHLSNVLRGWGLFTAQSLSLVPNLVANRELIVNGVRYEVRVPRAMSEGAVARFISVEFPVAISRYITGLVGTEKLERQLKEPKFSEVDEPFILQFYRHALMADLKIVGWVKAVEKLRERSRGRPYVLELLLRKLSDIYTLGDYAKSLQTPLQSVVGKIIGELRGKDAKDRTQRTAKAIQTLRLKANLRRLRLSSAGE